MNTDELIIYMVSTAVFTLVAAVLGFYAFRSLHFAAAPPKHTMAPVLRKNGVRPAISSRRAHSYPGIICALPMYQVKRAEPPMSER